MRPLKHQARVAANNGEYVVKVVSDAGRELANGIHFLRLQEGGLGASTFGDFGFELGVGFAQLLGPAGDGGVERANLPADLPSQEPFL
jgi:hypothetical protein